MLCCVPISCLSSRAGHSVWTGVFDWCQWRLPIFHTPTSPRCGLSSSNSIRFWNQRNPIAQIEQSGRYPHFSVLQEAAHSILNGGQRFERNFEINGTTQTFRYVLRTFTSFYTFTDVPFNGTALNMNCAGFPSHCAAIKNIGVFSKLQALRLRDALASIQHVDTEGFDHAVVMPEDVVDIMLRCDCRVRCWQLTP